MYIYRLVGYSFYDVLLAEVVLSNGFITRFADGKLSILRCGKGNTVYLWPAVPIYLKGMVKSIVA